MVLVMAKETKRITSAVETKYRDMLDEMAMDSGESRTFILEHAIEMCYAHRKRHHPLDEAAPDEPASDNAAQEWR